MNTLKLGNKYSIANRACLVFSLVMSLGLWSSATAQSFPASAIRPMLGHWPAAPFIQWT